MAHNVSAFILTQNNETTIGECLESVQWCDEIVVIDSFSTDATLDIVARYPKARVHQHAYTTAAEQRIWGMPHVTTEWVFIIDSDEACTPPLAARLQQILAQERIEPDGYVVSMRTRFLGRQMKQLDYLSSRGKRLVLTSVATRYKQNSRVHAKIQLDRLARLPDRYRMIHNPIRSMQQHLAKMTRYASWQAQDMHDRGKTAHWWHFTLRPMYKFFHYYVILGQFKDGVRGLILSMLAGWSIFLKYLLLLELQHCPPPEATDAKKE